MTGLARGSLHPMSEGQEDAVHLGFACQLGIESVLDGGGPFGAVVVRDGVAVATGVNRVTHDHDATAHAEMTALRAAGAALGTHELVGCTLYASCRPCPMCMTAAWWARVDRIVFAAESHEAAAVGFDDVRFWEDIADPERGPVPAEHVEHPAAREPFEEWVAYEGRQRY